MPKPATTTEYSEDDAKAELTLFFMNRSATALEQSIRHLRDRDFFSSVQAKLKAGADLSNDLPELNIKGMKVKAPTIINKLRDQAMTAALESWKLKGGPAKVFNTTIRTHNENDSNLLCFDVEYSSNTEEGITRVNVKTWRRNVEVVVSGNSASIQSASNRLVMAGLQN